MTFVYISETKGYLKQITKCRIRANNIFLWLGMRDLKIYLEKQNTSKYTFIS